MDKEYMSIKKESLIISMNTTLPYNETILLSYDDKKLISEIFKEKTDSVKTGSNAMIPPGMPVVKDDRSTDPEPGSDQND